MRPATTAACALIAVLAAGPASAQIPDHVSLTNAGGIASTKTGALSAIDRRLHPGASQADIKLALRTSKNTDLNTLYDFINANNAEIVIAPGGDFQVTPVTPGIYRLTIGADFMVSPQMITRISPPLAAPGRPLPPIPRF